MSNLTISELKSRGEFFKKDSIIPQRILKGRRKTKCFVVFCSDSWVIPSYHGYVVMVDSRNSDGAIRVRGPRKDSDYLVGSEWRRSFRNNKQPSLRGSPYFYMGITRWMGNSCITDDEWAASIERELGDKP
ncbi:hypothetical protein [Yersinia proxima]|uniref:hypothetical protein n=1 Tax=Yersinia proxima TaxID=2890316 RepID=UPI003D698836